MNLFQWHFPERTNLGGVPHAQTLRDFLITEFTEFFEPLKLALGKGTAKSEPQNHQPIPPLVLIFLFLNPE